MTAQILLVDDEPDMKALVLQKFRHQIGVGAINFLFASDGIEALAMLEANSGIDMVVADTNMPRMDGLTLLQKLRETTESISTIIVSAYGDMSNIRAAMNCGAFDFLTKPIDFLDFETTIAKTIRHVEVLREARRRQAEAERAQATLSRSSRPIWPSGLITSSASPVSTLSDPPRILSKEVVDKFNHHAMEAGAFLVRSFSRPLAAGTLDELTSLSMCQACDMTQPRKALILLTLRGGPIYTIVVA